jgi:hypothetical protein
MNLPAKEIIEILKPAYNPCEFFGACTEANWDPKKGHIPRGYLGATGELSEVEVVIVLAEPSHPLEEYPEQSDPISYISACVSLAYECYAFNTYQGKPLKVSVGHTNLIYILDSLFPDHSFDEQLRKVWITESRLCSIDKKIGEINKDHRLICSNNYLQKQLQILSHADVIGFGKKAQEMLSDMNIKHHKASAIYPPEGNKPRAKKSWDEIIKEINRKKTTSNESLINR